MTGSGAVFFLGSRAHYQALQQPDTFDSENGNASTDTIYQNPSVQELWASEQRHMSGEGMKISGGWKFCDNQEDKKAKGNGTKRRLKRRPSETILCERDLQITPAMLNSLDDDIQSMSPGRRTIHRLLSSFSRRKRRLEFDRRVQYLNHLESALTVCSYSESCRCLECQVFAQQSRYFDCDESDEDTSDDDESTDYSGRYQTRGRHRNEPEPDDDDEVFIDKIPDDTTSTDMLIENKEKMSTSSDEILGEDKLQLEVVATTPVLLNYLLTHPITCVLQ